ncbi:RHS repeat-associated core domain-containing protein [Acinetobacter baumannii]|uniref:RHS repeat-associated core domain-containing protein n=6 Tax=Acinetobacter calcoaceticus/baumannii complex TaxID=909768 RepID=UPI001FD67E37|nr:RHS repeat-associated core domain-containing protein [Acinetobacter baumannii]MDC4331346.1 RHS domain-containing protein [Acinetobacter baumannii]MDC5155386.1 RHS domain-containing protein [Acinetobacter baumannii]MDC5532329.1 RHS domain-containing protein [Acinetobacter baumannii]MDO7509024.1 RHS repeat-associated core domain-containing protein [Acinetobacter baumannii]
MSQNSVVAPLNTFSPKDLTTKKAEVDKWFREYTDGIVTVDRLETICRNVPVLGSAFAVGDIIIDIISMINKGIDKVEIFDWLNLGIDVIGLAPIPSISLGIRGVARPALFYVKNESEQIIKAQAKKLGKQTLTSQEVKKALSTGFKDSASVFLTTIIAENVAGTLEKFAKEGQSLLNQVLKDVGNWIITLTNAIDTGLKKLVSGSLDGLPNLKRAGQQSLGVIKGIFELDGTRVVNNAKYATENVAKTVGKGYVNLANLGISTETRAKILALGTKIRSIGQVAQGKVNGLSDPNTLWTIGWLFSIMGMVAAKHRQKKAQIKAKETTKANATHPSTATDKSNKQAHAENNANQCKNCMGGTGGSITFAMGTEFFTHVDAQLGGIIQDSISRTYVSNLYQMDDAIFGARWVTPFTTKISRKFKYSPEKKDHKDYLNGLEYIGLDGRAINLPDLKKGQSIYDPIEQYTYTVLSDELHLIAYGEDEKRYYEKYGEDYRLSYIERKNGFKVALRYDHVSIDNKTILSDILFKQDDNLLAHLALQLTPQGLVSDIWTIKNGQLDRVLASYDYDQQGDLIQATNEFAASYYYQYIHHLITRYTDLTHRGMNLKWDGILPTSKAIEEWADNASRASKLEWDKNIRKTTVLDVEGNSTEHYYDIDGYTYRIVYPDNFEEWFFRDDAKNITLHIAKDGSKTSYTYDERGNVLTTTQDDGATSYFEYDEKNQLTGMVDAEQGRWFKQYDGSGNLIKEIDPLKHETAYAYNAMGLVTSITDAKGGSKSLKYDDQGNLISYTDCSGKETKWQYDERGRVISIENALKQKVEYFYTELTLENREPIIKSLPLNAFGQLEKIKHADGTEEHFIHDAEGRLLAHVDPKQNITRYEYDEAGLILSRTDALNHKLKYKWDRLGRLTRLINENGASYQFFYDLGGRLIKEIDFDGKETVYHYDENSGQLATSIEVASAYGQDLKDRAAPKDRIQQFIFDSMGRLEQRTAGYGHYGLELEEKQTEEFAYDYMGRIIQAKNAQSNLQWFYDAAGNLVQEHQQDYKINKTAVWKHQYDEINDRIKTTRPDGQIIDWLTYGSGHVQSLIVNGQDLVSFERDDLHREIARHYANGVSQEQQYDLAGRLKSQMMLSEHENGYQNQYKPHNNALEQTSQLVQRLYQYDKTGELTAIRDTRRGNIAYQYDPVGRLLEASSKLGKETFSFDPASNIIDSYHSQKAQSHLQSEQEKDYGYNRLVNNVVKEYLDQQYQYDAYGQLVRQKTSQGDLNLEWDVYGRLVRSRNSQYTAEYRYDALGRRIQKRSKHHHTGQEQNIIYGWDGDTLAYESTEQLTKHYIYEKDSFVPMLQAVYLSPIELHQTPDWSDRAYNIHRDPLWKTEKQGKEFDDVWFYHCDHLGTPQEMTDHTGAIIWKAEYKAWGECKTERAKSNFFENSEIISNNIRFQGQYFDEETGLHYNRYRYYSPYVGRFVSKDPIGLLGGNNVYAYAPNPIEWADALGLSSCKLNKKINIDAIVKKYGGKHLTSDYYEMPSHKAAKQAAAEIAGNLSSTPQTTRRKDYRGGPRTWGNSNGVIGKTSGGLNPCSGWRDDSPGHSFNDKNGKTEIPSHLNAWNKLGGVENVHLLYKKGLIVDGKSY